MPIPTNPANYHARKLHEAVIVVQAQARKDPNSVDWKSYCMLLENLEKKSKEVLESRKLGQSRVVENRNSGAASGVGETLPPGLVS